MTPTKEQLANPKWWREKAPLGATHAAFRNQEDITWYKGIASNGCMVWNPSENTWVWCLGSPVHGPLIERPTQPQWTEGGLPPAGVECKFRVDDEHSFTWAFAKAVGYDGPACVVAVDGYGYHGSSDPSKFRPLRTQAEIERESVISEALNGISQDYHAKPGAPVEEYVKNAFAQAYDAGMLRKPMSRKEAFERLRHGEAKFSDNRCNLILDALGYKD